MSSTRVSGPSHDISTFLPLISRLYASSLRLVSTPTSGLTADIDTVLACSLQQESFVEVLREGVQAQRARWGCGGRTVALWTCLFVESFSELRGIEMVTAHALLHMMLDHVTGLLATIPTGDMCIERLAEGISHNTPEWQLAIPVSLTANKCSSLSPNFLDNLLVQVEKSHGPSGVVDGCLLRCADEQVCGAKSTLLVAGDLAEKSGHIGYKGLVKERSVNTTGVACGWASKVLGLLRELDVQVVLCSGICKLDLVNTGISVLPEVSYEVLERLGEVSGAGVVPSPLFASSRDIVTLEYTRFSERLLTVEGTAATKTGVRTILLRCPTLCGQKQRYLSYIARLRSSLERGEVLSGAGRTEELCAGYLADYTPTEKDITRFGLAGDPDLDISVTVVKQILSRIFTRVAGIARRNGEDPEETSCLDNLAELTLDTEELSGQDTGENPRELSSQEEYSGVEQFDDLKSTVYAWGLALEVARTVASVALTLKPISNDSTMAS